MEFDRHLLTTAREVEALCNRLDRYPKIGLDTESSAPLLIHKPKKKSFINIYRSTLTGISLASPGGQSYYIPVGHRKRNASLAGVKKLYTALSEYKGTIAIHNVKHELDAMTRGPFEWEGFRQPPHCTQVLAWLLQRRGDGGGYGLKDLAPTYLGIEMSDFSEVVGANDFSQLLPEEGLDYACEDAEAALLLHDKLYPELTQFKGMEDTYLNVELPFIYVLRHMESAGFDLDVDHLEGVIAEFEAELEELRALWAFEVGDLNPNSSQQLQWLYEEGHWKKWGVPKKATGYSTEAEWVERQLVWCKEGSLGHLAAELKLLFSQYSKLVGTYGHKMAAKAGQYPDLRLHAEYNHTGTATGRLSSSYPNLQNIPKRTQEGKRIREAFVAPEGWTLMSADYSQIELRVLAHYCGKGALYQGYQEGQDVHQATADDLGIGRDQGKTTNFSTVYGIGASKLARRLQTTTDEARDILKRFRSARPEVQETLAKAVSAAERRGYVRTLLGRIRRLPGLAEARDAVEELKEAGHSWDNSEEYKEALLHFFSLKNKAGNTPIQGGARDVMTLGMLDFFRQIDTSTTQIIGQVHDDLILRTRKGTEEEVGRILQESLEGAYELKVPLVAEPAMGDRWSEL